VKASLSLMKLKLCDSQLVPSWMQWVEDIPMCTNESPADLQP